ncbi:MAG: helix-turn-helix domain-containing protein [Lachnospiraceae bacterium]
MSTIERIIELMKKNNIKDAELERMLGLKPKIIYGWKTGRSKSYMDFIPQLSQIFNVSSNYLLGETDIPNNKGPIALSRPNGYEKLTDEERAFFDAMIEKYTKDR